MTAHPHVPPVPASYRADFARLSQHIRDWELNPPFRVGDTVRRKPGILDAVGALGVVRSFVWRGAHLCAEVTFGWGTECFVHGTYERCDR